MTARPVQQYRKKPVVIEARYYDCYLTAHELAAWCGGIVDQDPDTGVFIYIPTREGVMRANVGDYIIKGMAGEFYPCKEEIFRATYEEV